jgi:2-polyprenyl-6-methoxyphenol hydroxylase-like FAD-dependent oxidoreductase
MLTSPILYSTQLFCSPLSDLSPFSKSSHTNYNLPTMSQLKILVVGASIAGPMTAYWLSKAGAKVTVIERYPSLRTNGQGIDIRTTGVTVMRKIPGMEAAVRAKTTQMEGMSLVNGEGQSLGVIRATGNPDQQSLLSEYEIFRGDLSQILFDLSKDNENVRYIFGEHIASIRQEENGNGHVKVEFENGLPSSEYDLVVACDGATSRTRAMGFGGSVRDFVTPINSWSAFFSIDKDLINGSKLGHGYSAIGGRFLDISTDLAGGNRIMLMNIHPRVKQDLTLPFREAMKHGEDALKHFIARHYAGAGWKTEEVMSAMTTSSDFYASETVQVKVPNLYRGHIVLVGDAGYAPGSTGTGTTLAMTGAYVLAGEIAKHAGDLEAGLKGYEERMKPIINDMQKIPPLISSFAAPQTAWGIWLRNAVFTFVAWSNILEYAQRFFGAAFADVDKYGLPDYDWMN